MSSRNTMGFEKPLIATSSKCKGAPTVENGIGNSAKGHKVYYIRKRRFNCKGQRDCEGNGLTQQFKRQYAKYLDVLFCISLPSRGINKQFRTETDTL